MPNSSEGAALQSLGDPAWAWSDAGADVLESGIFASASVALLRLNADLVPVAANDAYRVLVGAQGIDEVPDYRALLDEADLARHDSLLANLTAGKLASFRIELSLRFSQRKTIAGQSSSPREIAVLVGGASISAKRGQANAPGFVVSLTDVSGLRRNMEVESRRREALDQALDEMVAGLVLFDAEDRLVFCNRRYREFYGVPDELARSGTRFIDMLLEEVRSGKLAMGSDEQARFVAARLERRMAGVGEGPVVETAIIEQRNSDGRWLQIRERVMPGGWVVGVHVDATALKDKEQALEAHIRELREMRAELERRAAELSQLATNLAVARDEALAAARVKANFLANMSHELRTPLNAVIGFAEILAGGAAGSLTEQQTEYLTDIRNSGNHLLGVINDILDISKADAGKIVLQEDDMEIAEFLTGTARLMLQMARSKNLVLLTDIPAALNRTMVKVDVRRFRQVLLNVLSNAIKFTPEQGSVKISLAKAPDGGPEEGGIVITVSDTGIGIAHDDLGKVFAPFEQADTSLARKYEGTGLGLTLVKALIDLHQGWVRLDSTPGLGTQVRVWLPPARVSLQG
jgi:two-component system cell cycle sensor histidine kinase PleC